MITFIRSLSELMAVTESRDNYINLSKDNEDYSSTVDSGQRKRYIKSLAKNTVNLPDIPKTMRRKWTQNKKSLSRFFNELDYNNQIQPSYDLTLLERQNNRTQQDVA